jgi:endonuclease III related protein
MNYIALYKNMLRIFGPQHWWPSESDIETLIGAILVQNTNWLNAEKSLNNIREKNNFVASKLLKLSAEDIKKLIIPSGFYNAKSRTIYNTLQYFSRFDLTTKSINSNKSTAKLRKELLNIKGIGNETADVILLYVFQRPVFVADSYSRKMIGFFEKTPFQKLEYMKVKQKMEKELGCLTINDFQEFHALIDEHIIDYFKIYNREKNEKQKFISSK